MRHIMIQAIATRCRCRIRALSSANHRADYRAAHSAAHHPTARPTSCAKASCARVTSLLDKMLRPVGWRRAEVSRGSRWAFEAGSGLGGGALFGRVPPERQAAGWLGITDVVAHDQVGPAVAVHVTRGAGQVVATLRFERVADELARLHLLQEPDGVEAQRAALREHVARKEGGEGDVEQAVAVEVRGYRAAGAVAVGQAVRL